MDSSRLMTDLHPDLYPIAMEFLHRCELAGIRIIVTCTYRSNAEQNKLYAQGRTTKGKIVTNAKEGQSKHNFTIDGKPAAKAFDIVPMRYGKPAWGTTGEDGKLWKEAGKIGMELGLNWYGRPDAPFKEFPHFELKEKA